MAATPLDAIVTAAETPAPDLPRLQSSRVFIEYGALGKLLERAANAYHKLVDDNPQNFDSDLLEIVTACEGASKKAMRLREANR